MQVENFHFCLIVNIYFNKVFRQFQNIVTIFSDENGDYESNVPGKYTKDGKPHCYLYTAIQYNEK